MKKYEVTLTAFVGIIFLFAAPLSVSAISTSTSPIHGVNVNLGPMAPAVTKFYSYNWAGYGVNSSSGSVTSAAGSWIEPSVKCNPNAGADQAVVFWVGVDGLTDGTVEQTGTLAYCFQGYSTADYYAWYEYYPAQPIITVGSMTVTPGDVFKAVISAPSDTSFKVTLTDVTTGVHFSKGNPNGFRALRADAECITETPSGSSGYFLIPNFGTSKWGATFTDIKNTCTATIGGKTSPIGSFGAKTDELTICNYSSCSTILVKPTALKSDLESFKTIWKNSGP